ncbi:thioredoxin-like protein [Zychaea mexicana]|uniref:thioredoxin-like protein n=1 Tax=Zychaea mexicana TaxID=64656 RepID=UPI0022FDF0B4|nr:thioredoxin-like protein [Zychaea mexicana]KAI9496985.1 thioredoxin-like protein [Zychaea mexicana]
MATVETKPVLYGSWNSSAAWRVRLILAWKNIEYEYRPIDLKNSEDLGNLAKVNPSKRIPAFITSDGVVLTQSMAILEYIEEMYPEKTCLPADPLQRAMTREICDEIACDIHPIQNTGLLNDICGGDWPKFEAWARSRITKGFDHLEAKLREDKEHVLSGKYCIGDCVTMADFVLVPQFYNAVRYMVDLSPYPIIGSIHHHLMTDFPELIETVPERQVDAPAS